MAQVANCPKCSRELLIGEGTDPTAWARCPECRAFFQVKTAPAREIRAALMVGSESAASNVETVFTGNTSADSANASRITLSRASLATISERQPATAGAMQNGTHTQSESDLLNSESVDLEPVPDADSLAENEPGAVDSLNAVVPGAMDAIGSRPTERRPPDFDKLTAPRIASDETSDDTADRVDKWFRTEKARVESGHDSEADDDLDLGSEAAAADGRATWDDSEHMDRLLADVERTIEEQDRLEAMADADDSVRDEPEIRTPRQEPVELPPKVFIPPGRLPRRERSAVRMIAGIVIFGMIGLAIGYYALLWIAGSPADFLNIAHHLPSAMLPAEFRPVIVVQTDADDPAEIQTSYSEPVEQSEPSDSSPDEATIIASDTLSGAGDEPPTFSADTAQPLVDVPALDTPVLEAGQLESPPSFTVDELAVALRTAEEAQPGLVNGDLKDGQQVQRAKGLGYSLLCDLAQKKVFVDSDSRAEYANSLATKAENLFRRTLADAHTRSEVAVIVQKWIDSPHRKHGGVFFGATLARDAEEGSVTECQFDLGNGQSLTVLVPPAAAKELSGSARPLGVIGWIVDNPVDEVNGYTGDAPQAIWAGQVIPLE